MMKDAILMIKVSEQNSGSHGRNPGHTFGVNENTASTHHIPRRKAGVVCRQIGQTGIIEEESH